MSAYKVIYFADNGVLMCKTFTTESLAREYATTLGDKWYSIVSYTTSATVVDITNTP